MAHIMRSILVGLVLGLAVVGMGPTPAQAIPLAGDYELYLFDGINTPAPLAGTFTSDGYQLMQ